MSHCEGVTSTIIARQLPRLSPDVNYEIMTQSSPVHGSSASPRSILHRDSDEVSPCCNTRWARSPRMTDVPTVLMSPTAVSSWDSNVISLADLAGDDVVVTVDLPSVIAPPGKNGRESGGPTSARDSEPASMSEFSSDTDPDLEDEICRFQPLQATISPLSQYPAPAVPVLPLAASSTRVSPAPIREAYSPGTLDVFPTYVPSPDVSFYVPTTSPVTPAQTLDIELLSPGGPASMDNLLAGDSSLMDRDQDLALFPLPLLPLPDNFRLLQDTALGLNYISVVGLSPPDTGAPVVPASGDLSREGPFDVHGGTSDTGDVPLILDGLPGARIV